MKKINGLLCLLLLLFIGMKAQALDDGTRLHLGVKAGVNLATEQINDSGYRTTMDRKIRMLGGLVCEYSFDNDLISLGSGILFSQKGMEFNDEYESIDESLNYIDIPLDLIFKLNLGGPRLLIEMGPQLSVGLNGKNESRYMDEVGDLDVEFGSDPDQYKRFELGANVGGGVEYGNFQLKGNYSTGLTNMLNIDSFKLKNKVISISLTYFFQ